MTLYSEPFDAANKHREEILRQIEALIAHEREQAEDRRRAFVQPDHSSPAAYARSIEPYRRQFCQMLGWPLTLDAPTTTPPVRQEAVAEDGLGRISRLWVEALPGLETYGLLFTPHGEGPFPLAIAQHGGLGTPELCSGFFGYANYNDMTRRVLRRGVAVFAPQLLLWGDMFGPEFDRPQIDVRLKQLGGSITALEIWQIRRCLDAFIDRPRIDGDRLGMIGLSYGGFYTLFTAAVETRLRVALSSCFFNSRTAYDWPDWTWFNAANTFLDAEVAALVCPRALCIEVGQHDELFDVALAAPEVDKVRAHYERLGLASRFRYTEHPGVHELDTADEGIDFFVRHLSG